MKRYSWSLRLSWRGFRYLQSCIILQWRKQIILITYTIERFFWILKCEMYYGRKYHTWEELIQAIMVYIDYYINDRLVWLHFSCSEKWSHTKLAKANNGIRSFIKQQDHEKRKTQAYKEDIGKYYNMTYAVFEDEYYYICHDGRELRYIRTESKEQGDYTQTIEVYGCADCSECEYKSKCFIDTIPKRIRTRIR